MTELLHIAPLGEAALTASLGDRVDPALNRRVHALAEAVRQAAWPGVTAVVPAYATLSLFYEPQIVSFEALAARLQALAAILPDAADAAPAREIVLPVRYDGPDLAEVAARTGLSVEAVVARHTGRRYRVYLMGFVPGFAYLGELDAALVLPRRETPRPRVPAGSVAIAGAQTAVYPLATPGGWHLLGHTDARLFDPSREAPSLLRPGDWVRFKAVGC